MEHEINKQMSAARKADERNKEKLQAELRDVTKRQDIVAAQVTERLTKGNLQIDALNKMLDELQKQREEIEADLSRTSTKRTRPPKTFIVNPSMYAAAIGALTVVARTGNSENDDVQRHFNFIRELVQKVIIVPSADGKAAELTIVGRLASILASMRAFQDYSAGLRQRHHDEYTRRAKASEFDNLQERLDFQARFQALLAKAEADWKRLQVSLVAGA